MSSTLKSRVALTAIAAVVLSIGANLQAQSVWTGGGGADTSWSNVSNWLGGQKPLSTDDVFFGQGGSLAGGGMAASVTFDRAGDFVLSGTLSASNGIYVDPSDGLGHNYSVSSLSLQDINYFSVAAGSTLDVGIPLSSDWRDWASSNYAYQPQMTFVKDGPGLLRLNVTSSDIFIWGGFEVAGGELSLRVSDTNQAYMCETCGPVTIRPSSTLRININTGINAGDYLVEGTLWVDGSWGLTSSSTGTTTVRGNGFIHTSDGVPVGPGGTMVLDYTQKSNADHIDDACNLGIQGRLIVVGHPTEATLEKTGTLATYGVATIDLRHGSGGPLTLRASGLINYGYDYNYPDFKNLGTWGTMKFVGSDLGTASTCASRVMLDALPTGMHNGMLPTWIRVGSEFAAYDSVLGLKPYYDVNRPHRIGSGENVELLADQMLGLREIVWTLKMNGTVNLDLGGLWLQIMGDGLIQDGGLGVIYNGLIRAGTGNDYLLVQNETDLMIEASFQGRGITKCGVGKLSLLRASGTVRWLEGSLEAYVPAGSTVQLSGAGDGDGALIKDGPGAMVIQESLRHTGGTYIRQGELQVNPTWWNSLPQGDVYIGSGATLKVLTSYSSGLWRQTIHGNGIVTCGTHSLDLSACRLEPSGEDDSHAGILTIAGDVFLYDGDNKIVIDVVGSQQVAGVDYDQLAFASATYMRDVDLEINLKPGTDLRGDRLTILKGSLGTPSWDHNDGFRSVSWHGGYGNLTISSTNVTIWGLVHDGDANRSGLVDQDDYKIWYDNYGTGTTWAQGNFKGYGVTDQDDYKTWYDNYGAGSAAGSDVPEPATMMMLAAGGAALLRQRRRRHRLPSVACHALR